MKFVQFLEGFILGSLVGAGLALLLTPSSGEELRNQLQSGAEKLRLDVETAASDRRAELESQLAALRESRKPSAM